MRKLFISALSLMMIIIVCFPPTGRAEEASGSDAAQQYAELQQKGILEGFADGSAGLERKMSRAELAAALVRLLKLKRESGIPSYEDTSAHWAHEQGYIEAVTAAKLMEGTKERVFDPDGNVTLEQLAAALVRALGLAPVADAQIKGKASDWAVGFVAAAVQEKLLDEHPDYTQAATRNVLTAALYAADGKLKQPSAAAAEPLSILEFKATGAKKLGVKLNQPVDPEKITFEVKRADTLVEGKTSFQENRESAEIVFESPLKEGTYSIELKGLEAENAGAIKAETAVEQERLEKIEFLTASDTLPRARNVYVEFNALNQYGETATWSASRFDIQTGNADFTPVNDRQAIKLHLQDKDENSHVSVSIIHPDSGLSVQKTFTVGDLPYVSNIDVGELLFPGAAKKLSAGFAAYLKIRALDQYGIPVMAIEETDQDEKEYGLNTSIGVDVSVKDSSVLQLADELWEDYDNDGFPELKIIGGTDAGQARESEITLYALGSGQSVTKTIQITVSKAPFSVQFGEFKKTVAAGDKDIVLPLIVKDDQGATLSPHEVAESIDQLDVSDTLGSAAEVKLEAAGKTRGLLVITGLKKGSGTVTVRISGTDKKASLPINVQEERYPAEFFIKTDLAPFYLPGAEDGLVLLIKDQYGDFIRNASNEYISVLADSSDATKVRTDAVYKIHATYKNMGDASENGALTPTSGPLKTAIDALRAGSTSDADAKEQYVINETFAQSGQNNQQGLNIGNIYNTKMSFKADSQKTGTYQITLKLVKIKDKDGKVYVEELDTLTKSVRVIDGTDSDITYQVTLDTAVNNTIFAAVDAYRDGDIEAPTVTASAYGVAKDRIKLAKEVVLSGKKSGQDVEVPSFWMHSISSSNTTVASAVYINTGTEAAPVYKYYVIGDEEGTATLTFVYQSRIGVKATSRIEVKTSGEHPDVVKTTSSKAYAQTEYAKISGKKMWDYSLMGEVALTDQYGSAYKNDAIATHADVLGLSFYATDIVYKTAAGDDTVTVNPSTGVVTYTGDGDIASFTLVIAAPNGKKVQTIVNLP